MGVGSLEPPGASLSGKEEEAEPVAEGAWALVAFLSVDPARRRVRLLAWAAALPPLSPALGKAGRRLREG